MTDETIPITNLSKVCRLCLTGDEELVDLFTFSLKLRGLIVEIVMMCAPVHISRNDELPKCICNMCYDLIEKFYRFRLNAVQSEKTLWRYFEMSRSSESSDWPVEDSDQMTVSIAPIECDVNIEVTDIKYETEMNDQSDHISVSREENDPLSLDSTAVKEEPLENAVENHDENELNFDPVKIDQDNYFDQNSGDVSGKILSNIEDRKNETMNYIKTVKRKKKPMQEDGSASKPVKSRSTKKPYQCDSCGKCFTYPSDLVRHKRVHTGEKPYVCDECSMPFKESSHLKQHKRIHSDVKPHLCNVCNKLFRHLSGLRAHQRLHTGERLFKCEMCPKSFNRSTHLENHRRIHTGERPFQCEACNKTFSDPSTMRKHRILHLSPLSVKCDVCGACFKSAGSLQKHQVVHTGEKPNQCNVCGKSFARMCHLKLHQRVHTGERPYKCEFCPKTFRDPSAFNKHKPLHAVPA